MPRSLLLRSPAFICVSVAFAQDTLYQVNVLDVVCSGGPGASTVQINSPNVSRRGATHVPLLFRTSPAKTKVTFNLTDSENKVVIPSQTIELQDKFTGSRRLGGGHQEEDQERQRVASVNTDNCEEFFLLDGRSPVELPDTWGEARAAFAEICTNEGTLMQECLQHEEDLFSDQPRGMEVFEADADFCQRLVGPLGLPLTAARRLKGTSGGSTVSHGGYYTAGGASAVGSHRSAASPGLGSYGYTASGIGRKYPRGYATTGYGFAGRGGYAPYLFGGVASFWVVSSMYGGGFGRYSDPERLQDNNSSGSAAECSDPFQCSWKLQHGEELLRDDLMSLGFLPVSFAYPLTLHVTQVAGPDYEPSRICPPIGSTAGTWTPPVRQDLFFGLSEVEELEYVDPEGLDVWLIIGISLGVMAALCVFFGCIAKISKMRTTSRRKRSLEMMRGLDGTEEPEAHTSKGGASSSDGEGCSSSSAADAINSDGEAQAELLKPALPPPVSAAAAPSTKLPLKVAPAQYVIPGSPSEARYVTTQSGAAPLQ